MSDEVRLHVKGRHGDIDVSALQRAVDGLVDLLKGAPAERWVVSELRSGSLTTAVRPIGADSIELDIRFAEIVAGITALNAGPATPAHWSDRMLEGVALIGEVNALPGVDGVEIQVGTATPMPVTHDAGKNARAALDNGPQSFGSVDGTVDRFLSRQGRREFGLVDASERRVVTVRFGRSDEEAVRAAIGKRVLVWGVLRRTPEGRKKELKMEGLTEVARTAALTVDDITGALGADWTDGASSIEAIRRQRDDV